MRSVFLTLTCVIPSFNMHTKIAYFPYLSCSSVVAQLYKTVKMKEIPALFFFS